MKQGGIIIIVAILIVSLFLIFYKDNQIFSSVIDLPNGIKYTEKQNLSFNGGIVFAVAPRFGFTSTDTTVITPEGHRGRICNIGSDDWIQLESNLENKPARNGFLAEGKLISNDNNANCRNYISQDGNITFTKSGIVTASCEIELRVSGEVSSGQNVLAYCKIGNKVSQHTLSNEHDMNYDNTETFTFNVVKGETIPYEISHSVDTTADFKSSYVGLLFGFTEKCISGDTNCDNIITRDELGTSINKWLNGVVTRESLGIVIQTWANS